MATPISVTLFSIAVMLLGGVLYETWRVNVVAFGAVLISLVLLLMSKVIV